jgi:predicted ATP-dependent protease
MDNYSDIDIIPVKEIQEVLENAIIDLSSEDNWCLQAWKKRDCFSCFATRHIVE